MRAYLAWEEDVARRSERNGGNGHSVHPKRAARPPRVVAGSARFLYLTSGAGPRAHTIDAPGLSTPSSKGLA
jgi:hypothetical protein